MNCAQRATNWEQMSLCRANSSTKRHEPRGRRASRSACVDGRKRGQLNKTRLHFWQLIITSICSIAPVILKRFVESLHLSKHDSLVVRNPFTTYYDGSKLEQSREVTKKYFVTLLRFVTFVHEYFCMRRAILRQK